ncbi:MAG: hypothetical protein LBD32_01750 [Cytophagales bacterium]|jgi:hypothetical protein|nr:hypothetical protein [Cytophagales bacterium]
MTNKFLANFFLLSIIFSCSTPTNYPVEDEYHLDFNADPNNFGHFEKNFDKLVHFIKKSLGKKSDIGPQQIRECVKYILSYEDLENFYERSKTEQFLKEDFQDFIFALASHYKGTLQAEISRFARANPKTECALEKIVEEVYTKRISEMKKIEEKKNSAGKILGKSSEIIDELRNFIKEQLNYLMGTRADIAFLYATSIIYDLKLFDVLLQKEDLRELVNLDLGQMNLADVEILKSLFAKELFTIDHLFFSEKDCESKKKSQREILFDEFEYFFNKKFPYISYAIEIRPYLEKQSVDVERNIKECIKEFFKINYQQYNIKFSKCSLPLLVEYLKFFNEDDDADKKKTFSEIFVLYLLNFKSDSLQRNDFVFNDMGHKMFRYEKFKSEDADSYNEMLDEIRNFITTNYGVMERELFEETTGKKIKYGEKRIIDELKTQIELAKRF